MDSGSCRGICNCCRDVSHDGGFGDDGIPVRVGIAAKALIEEMRERLIEMLIEASRVTAEDVA